MSTKVAIVTTLKSSLQNTLAFVNYHLNIGVNHIYLFFDDPNDVCIEALGNYQKVTCIRCDSKHWEKLTSQSELTLIERQLLNADCALELARRDRYNWLVHIDSDEIIHVKEPLDRLLSKVSKNIDVLVIHNLETVPERDKYNSAFEEITLFKNQDLLWQKYLAYFLGCSRVFQGGHYFRGHPYGKSAIRTNVDFESVGIHFPTAPGGKKVRAKRFSGGELLHFECCEFESWRMKWLRRHNGIAAFPEMTPYGKWKLSKFGDLYESGDENGLWEWYKAQYFLSNYEQTVLSMLGLLKRVQLDRKLFQNNNSMVAG
ncbi:MAG: glycosyltransferase family 2 protein [Xenococcaceae cyanobacterium]